MIDRRPSGRFVVRLPVAVHAQLRQIAAARGVSLNALCLERLGPAGEPHTAVVERDDADRSHVVEACDKAFGANLEGLALFGSLARGMARPSSDADLLIVLAEGQAITRALYSQWDGLELSRTRLAGHEVSPQFVVLPGPKTLPGGLWYEVALDGQVLFDRHGALSRALVRLRLDMAAGIIERKVTHGQPYWVRQVDHA